MNKLSTISGLLALAITFVGAVVAVETRYAHADEVKKVEQFTKYSLEELRLDRAQDKLIELELIPVEQKTDYQKAEIMRLEKLVNKIQQRLQLEAN